MPLNILIGKRKESDIAENIQTKPLILRRYIKFRRMSAARSIPYTSHTVYMRLIDTLTIKEKTID